MRWLTRHRLRNYVRNSAWLVPAAAIPVALVVSPLVRWFDDWARWPGMGYTTEGARSLLSAITPASLTWIVLILSILLLSVQLASSQFSPRLIGGLLARRPVKVCLFVFVFSYVYCAGVSGRVEGRVPQLGVLIAIVSTLVSVGAGLYLIDYMAQELRPVRLLARTATAGRAVIEQAYPNVLSDDPAAADDPPPGERPVLPEPCATVAHTARSGVLLAMDLRGLFELAQRAGGAIEVGPQVGDFVARGDPIFRVHPSLAGIDVRRLRASLAFGTERTLEQDPAFAFRILVDVASKALSPAINDPTTAVLAIDQVHTLLRQVGLRRLDTGEVRDAAGNLRLLYRTPDWDDFVLLAVTEVRQYGSGSIQVARRLGAMLENLIVALPRSRTAALAEQLRLLHASITRSFADPEDRLRAAAGDSQGIGGSRNGEPQRITRR
jgi:uncharacterized membrane protein